MKTTGIYIFIFILMFASSRDTWGDSQKDAKKEPEPVLELIGKLKNSTSRETCGIIFSLRKHRDYRAVSPLIQRLGHGDKTVQQTAALALLDLQDLDLVEQLLKALESPKPSLRGNVARVLGKTGDYRAIAPLTRLLEDKNQEVQAAARDALEMLKRPQTKTRKPTMVIPQNFRMVVGHPSKIGIYHYRENGDKTGFEEKTSVSMEFPRYLVVAKELQQIIAATPQVVTVLDYRLRKIHQENMVELGAVTVFRDYLLVSDDGYLKALHLRQNLKEITRIPLVNVTDTPDQQRKNAHDIVVYQDAAYILDNIEKPVYVVKVDLGTLDRGHMEAIKIIGVSATPANSTPHLDGQWLNPGANRWALVISASSYFSMGGSGGPSQRIYFLPMVGNPQNDFPQGDESKIIYTDSELPTSHGNTVTVYPALPDSIPIDKKAKLREKDFQIRAVTPLGPPWAVIEKHNKLFLVKVTPELTKEKANRYNASSYKVFLSRYGYLGEVKNLPQNGNDFHIRVYGELIFITMGRRLVVVERQHPARPIFQQDLPQAIRNFLFIYSP